MYGLENEENSVAQHNIVPSQAVNVEDIPLIG